MAGTELIKNGSFDSGSIIDSEYSWFKPTDWDISWKYAFNGSLYLESVGAVYGASNALLLNYTPSDDEFDYDIVFNDILPPGVCQIIDLRKKSLSSIGSFKFRMNARLVNPKKPCKVDIFIYKAISSSSAYDFDSLRFEDYMILREFEIKSSPTWNVITFDIDVSSMSNGVYKIYIAPHINITGVRYENIIEETNVIVDDVSFLAVKKKDPGVDLEDTGFIKNGSFTIWEDGKPKYWELINMDELYIEDGHVVCDCTMKLIPTNEYGRENSLRLVMDEPDEYTLDHAHAISYSKILPGVYQLLDLSRYEYGANFTFTYSARKDTNNYEYQDGQSYGIPFHIYRAKYNEDTGVIEPYGGLYSYVYGNPYGEEIEDYWKTYTDTITLNQGYYYLGFGPEHFTGYLNDGTTEAIVDDFYVVIDDVSGEIEPLGEVEMIYENLIQNGSFEQEFLYWTCNEDKIDLIFKKGLSYREEKYRTYKLGENWYSIGYQSNTSEEDKKDINYGLMQRVYSRASSDAIFSFWHNVNSSKPLTFKACIYETNYNEKNQSYTLLEPAILEETITTHSNWDNYAKKLSLKYNTHYTVVFYPSDEDSENPRKFNLDAVSLITFEDKPINRTGSFNNPFRTSNGVLGCHLDITSNDGLCTPVFYPYDQNLLPGKYFIKIPITSDLDSHYLCTNGEVDESGGFLCYVNGMFEHPEYEGAMCYFFEDGHMARNVVFEYNGDIYRANDIGIPFKYKLDIDYIRIPDGATSITIRTDETFILTPHFNEQLLPCTLMAEISNTSIATITGITEGTSSNEIKILGKRMGQTTLRIYVINADGSIVEKLLKIYVKDMLPEEYKEAKIYIPYDENAMRYSSSSNYSLQADYYILPDYLSDLPINWSSSNESIAVVDMNGTILSKGYGDCIITAKNAFSEESASFTLHVCDFLKTPTEVRVSAREVSLAIGDSTRITTKSVNYGDSSKVPQDVIWSSKNGNIATVDKYGLITGISRGTTEIVCANASADHISTIIQVTVTGSRIEIQDIELDCYKVTFEESCSDELMRIKHRLVPDNATDKDVVWVSDNEDSVRVTQGGYVYMPPNSTRTHTNITCYSKSRPDIARTCSIYFSYELEPSKRAIITSFDTDFNTCIGRKLRMYYDFHVLYREKGIVIEENDTYVSISPSYTTNTVSAGIDENGSYIYFTANETGTFDVKLTIHYGYDGTISKTFKVHVYEADAAPVLINTLNVLYALQNDSCILTCKIADQIDSFRTIDFYIDFNDGKGFEPVSAYFQPQNVGSYQYFFITGYKLTPGTAYQVKVKAVDSQGNEVTTNETTLTIPLVKDNHKAQLENAKKDYDRAFSSLTAVLSWLISPSENIMPASRKAEFFTQYRIFCYNYENLRDMLDQCIKFINSQIETSQVEMAAFSNTLSPDGVSIASYSEGDYTNSNYQSVSDMDYYQNECIKQLVARVLELEARLDELTSNNK